MLLRLFIFCWLLRMWPISCPLSPPHLLNARPFASNHGQRKLPLFFVPGQIGKNHNEQVSEKMKKGTNEWMNHSNIHSFTHSLNQWIKGLDDWTDERTNEWMDRRKNRWIKKMKKWIKTWMNRHTFSLPRSWVVERTRPLLNNNTLRRRISCQVLFLCIHRDRKNLVFCVRWKKK